MQIPIWWYYLCVGGAVLVTGISKAGFGTGAGIVAIPMMAQVMPISHVLGIMLPVLIAADVLSNLHYLREYEWRLLTWLLVGVLLGIGAGSLLLSWVLGYSDADLRSILSLVIGVVCLLFVVLQTYRLTGRPVPTLPPHPLSSAAVGTVAGLVSTISHSAGPIVSIYLLQYRLSKRKLVGTLLIYFLFGNLMKVPTFVTMGLINFQTLRDSIWFVPLLPVGTLLGAWMNQRISAGPFNVLMYGIASVGAVAMVCKALQ